MINIAKDVVGKYDDDPFKKMQNKTRDNLVLDCRVGDCVGFQISDIYSAQKVIMFLYDCLLTENVEPKELEAYIICVSLFNSMCACYMEDSWNESNKNEYAYIYDRNVNERDKIKMIKLKDNKVYKLQITKETIESFTEQELAIFLNFTNMPKRYNNIQIRVHVIRVIKMSERFTRV